MAAALGDAAPVAEADTDERLRLLEVVDLVSSTISRPEVGSWLERLTPVLVEDLLDSPTTKGDEACFDLLLSFFEDSFREEDLPSVPTARGNEACLEVTLRFLADSLSSSTTIPMGELLFLLNSFRSRRSLLYSLVSSYPRAGEVVSRFELLRADLSLALDIFRSSLPLSAAREEDLRVDLSWAELDFFSFFAGFSSGVLILFDSLFGRSLL